MYTYFWSAVDYVDLHLGVTLFLGIIFSIVISAIVYHLIEKPSIRWGRILQKKWHLPRTEREIDSLSAWWIKNL